ncbi:MAG: M20 family metallopeptidase [Caldilineales bacterium]|nr:M20 family metallopeptidase [Caldilineales bacterium]
MTDLLAQLVSIESPSLAPETQGPVFDLLAEQLAAAGYAARRYAGRRSGGVLLARPARRRRGAPLQVLIGHTDTVWPVGTLADMPLRVDQERLAGPGAFDMKGGLVLALFALQALHDLGLEPQVTPVVLFNSDEEIGSPDSRATVARLARIADRVLVLEPAYGPDGRLKTARKGVMGFEIVVTGKAAHAGLAPQEGVSAILELSYAVQKLFALNDPARGVTVNVGVVHGGTRPNVVAAEATAQVDVRVPTAEDGRRVADAILGLQPTLPGATVQARLLKSTPPLEFTPRNQRLWQVAQQAAQELGLTLDHTTAGGASDGNTASQYTATLDGLGPVGDGAHAAHEFVYLPSLPQRAALLALLLLAPPLDHRSRS